MSEKLMPNIKQLCIHQIPCCSITGHTPRPATPPPQPTQEEVLTEAELMDLSILDDPPDVINVYKEISSDFDC